MSYLTAILLNALLFIPVIFILARVEKYLDEKREKNRTKGSLPKPHL